MSIRGLPRCAVAETGYVELHTTGQDANGLAGRVEIARGVMERGCIPRGAGSAAARRAFKPG
jgi:hypothetical protein